MTASRPTVAQKSFPQLAVLSLPALLAAFVSPALSAALIAILALALYAQTSWRRRAAIRRVSSMVFSDLVESLSRADAAQWEDMSRSAAELGIRQDLLALAVSCRLPPDRARVTAGEVSSLLSKFGQGPKYAALVTVLSRSRRVWWPQDGWDVSVFDVASAVAALDEDACEYVAALAEDWDGSFADLVGVGRALGAS